MPAQRPGRPPRSIAAAAFVRAAAEMWDSDAGDRGEVGYMARLFAQTSLPYKDPGDLSAWVRRSGDLVLTVQPGMTEQDGEAVPIGYPFGVFPRLLLSWMCTEAVRTRDPVLDLGDSLAGFMRGLGQSVTGGRNGTVGRFRMQLERLAAASVSFRWEGDHTRNVGGRLNVAKKWDLRWATRDDPRQPSLLSSTMELSADFFNEVVERPVPVDLAAMRTLGSAMRMDLYLWLTYRMSYLPRETTVPWEALRGQFGSNLALDKRGKSQFKRDFTSNLGDVLTLYRDANVEVTDSGLRLRPSPTHVAFRGIRQLRAS